MFVMKLPPGTYPGSLARRLRYERQNGLEGGERYWYSTIDRYLNPLLFLLFLLSLLDPSGRTQPDAYLLASLSPPPLSLSYFSDRAGPRKDQIKGQKGDRRCSHTKYLPLGSWLPCALLAKAEAEA